MGREEMQNNHVETRVLDMFVELFPEEWSSGQTNIANEEYVFHKTFVHDSSSSSTSHPSTGLDGIRGREQDL